MIRESNIKNLLILTFDHDPKIYTKKSSNHFCLNHLKNIYFEKHVFHKLPWEEGFAFELYNYVWNENREYKYSVPLVESFDIADSIYLDDQFMKLALALKIYFDKNGGTFYKNFYLPKYYQRKFPQYAKRFNVGGVMIGLRFVTPKTLYRVLYNFYEYLFPGEGGNYAKEINFIKVQSVNNDQKRALDQAWRNI